jgi:plastocyanin
MGGNLKWMAGLALVAGGIAACGSDGGGGTNNTFLLSKEEGDAQTAEVATMLPTQLRVRVQRGGSNASGETVTWSTNGNGTADPASSATGSDGVATTSWTLGNTAGTQSVVAAAGGADATFTATATPGPAASFGKASGDGQSAGINAQFSQVLAAQVTDQFGNGVNGLLVSWTVQSGDVTLASGSSATNTQGLAAMQVTAGPTVGPAVVRATTTAVAGNADFTLNVTPPPVRVTAGDFFFLSVKNNSTNPAVDTATVGTPVVWFNSAGTHSVRSTGTPSFTSGDNIVTGGTYTVTFTQPGTYNYECGVHGAIMTGRVVVLP